MKSAQQTMDCIRLIPGPLNDSEINKIINNINMQHYCDRKNCYLNIFCDSAGNTDFNAAIQFFRDCRECTRLKTKTEREYFLIDSFKKLIIGKETIISDTTSIRFVHNWQLGGNKVCRKTWANAYKYTLYELDKCSDILRDNFETTSLTHKPYSDSHLHSYTFNETESMFMANATENDYGNE